MILRHCIIQIDDCSFRVKNTVAQSTYDDAGVNLKGSKLTAAKLYFKKINDSDANAQVIDLLSNFEYLFDCNGLVIDVSDFTDDKWMGNEFFPDWMYETKIIYTYDGVEYTDSTTTAFMARIKNIVYQQTIQSNWKKDLACTCGCEDYNSVLRKWNWNNLAEVAAELCLINEFLTMLEGLYKITGTTHEYA